jgi:hypothetical protein
MIHRFLAHSRWFCVILSAALLSGGLPAAENTLPSRLGDREFWNIINEFSEPNGYFRYDNLLSNEKWLQQAIPDLLERSRPGGVYLGVGPEQNFTYIAALRPRISFIVDIRRGNLHTHLMYKALFELSHSRADFISRLFTRPQPPNLGKTSTAQEIFDTYWNVPAGGEDTFKANLGTILDRLIQKHGFPLSADDEAGVEYVYRSFYNFGPGISYASSSFKYGGMAHHDPTYADLMVHSDGNGLTRSYLANEENFKTVKALQERNMIIPLVGDFAGPRTIRAVGEYLREHGANVTAFYVSNVEHYLDGVKNRFCANVASLPLDDESTFIRASRNDVASVLGHMQAETADCAPVPRR